MMAAVYSSRDIVEDYLRYRLRRGGVAWRQRRRSDTASPLPWRPQPATTSSHLAGDHPQQAPPRLQAALRSAGEELERRNRGDLSLQVSALRQQGAGAEALVPGLALVHGLALVRDELFSTGVNWGRIVVLMVLGGAVGAEAVRTGEAGQVDHIAHWLEESLNSPLLQGWIADNGGWDAFVELYESTPPVSFWSLRTICGLVMLGAAGMVLAALFTQR